jgi:hypothetical protein
VVVGLTMEETEEVVDGDILKIGSGFWFLFPLGNFSKDFEFLEILRLKYEIMRK